MTDRHLRLRKYITGYMRVACTLHALFLGVHKREGWEKVRIHTQQSLLPARTRSTDRFFDPAS